MGAAPFYFARPVLQYKQSEKKEGEAHARL